MSELETSPLGALPRLSLDEPPGLRPRDRFEAMRAGTTPLFELLPRASLDDSRYGIEGYLLDRLLFCRTTYSPAVYRRTKVHVERGEGNIVSLQLFEVGHEVVTTGAVDHMLQPGCIYVRDWAMPFTSAAGHTEQHSVVIPRELLRNLGQAVTRERPVFALTTGSGPGALLEHAWRSILAALPTLAPSQAPALAAQFVQLLDAVLGRRPPTETEAFALGRAKAEMIKAFVATNAHDPRIGSAMLARRFGCSRATLYRMFEDVGGVHAFVAAQRLELAYGDLEHASRGARVHEIARRWAYEDPSHFHRRFKARFGRTPGDVLRASVRPEPSAEQLAARLGRWVRSI